MAKNQTIDDLTKLFAQYPIKTIETDEQNDYYIAIQEKLAEEVEEDPSKIYIRDYLHLLTLAIQDFEENKYPIRKT